MSIAIAETPIFAATLADMVWREAETALAGLRDDLGIYEPCRVTAYRRGKCDRCDKPAERSRTFTRPGTHADDLRDVMAEAQAWAAGDVRHARCERRAA